MQHTFVFRWSALFTLIGALTLAIGYILRIDIEKANILKITYFSSDLSILLVGVGVALLIVGLPGLLALQLKQIGKGGLIASYLAYAGIALFHLGTLALYFVLPVLVQYSPDTRSLLYSDAPPFPYFALFWAISLLIQCIGLVWLAIKSLKAAVFPWMAPVFLLAGGLLFLLIPLLGFHFLKLANTLVMLGLMVAAASILFGKEYKEKLIYQEIR